MRTCTVLMLLGWSFLGLIVTESLSADQKPLPKLPELSVDFEGTNTVTISYSDTNGFPYPHPSITASINGVSGQFMIDTGTVMPLLSKQAVRRCGIAVLPSQNTLVDGGRMLAMNVATNVTVKLSPDFAIHWRSVDVLPTENKRESNFFGLLDYGTLRAGHAIMNMNHKTITLSR